MAGGTAPTGVRSGAVPLPREIYFYFKFSSKNAAFHAFLLSKTTPVARNRDWKSLIDPLGAEDVKHMGGGDWGVNI